MKLTEVLAQVTRFQLEAEAARKAAMALQLERDKLDRMKRGNYTAYVAPGDGLKRTKQAVTELRAELDCFKKARTAAKNAALKLLAADDAQEVLRGAIAENTEALTATRDRQRSVRRSAERYLRWAHEGDRDARRNIATAERQLTELRAEDAKLGAHGKRLSQALTWAQEESEPRHPATSVSYADAPDGAYIASQDLTLNGIAFRQGEAIAKEELPAGSAETLLRVGRVFRKGYEGEIYL